MEFRSRSFWKEVAAEFLATLLFLFMVCGTVLPWTNSPPSVMHIAFSHGLSIATLAMAVLHISGGQLNPAVTISMMAVGRVSVLKALFFIVAQCVGAICGAAIVYAITPSQSIGSLGVTAPANDVSTSQAFVIELVLTFILVFVIFAVTDPSRGMAGYGVPLAIGICVFICLMHGIPFSGASMNPARSLGPAVIMNSWKDHWIYWVAPIIGSLLATCTYQLLFAQKRTNQNTLQSDNYTVEMMDQNDSSKFIISSL
ncbi:hypothetical protein ACROYT_G008504 [Oculina patagonica]